MAVTGKTRRQPGRPPSIEDPHKTILVAAARLFSEKGYEETSLQDIASEIKYTKAGIYHYFSTKQEIFDSIVLKLLSDMRTQAEQAIAQEAAAMDKLERFVSAHAQFIADHLAEFRTMFNGRGGTAQAYTPEQVAARNAYENVLRDLLTDGVQAGEMRIADIAVCARAILGMLNWMSRWYNPAGTGSAGDISREFVRLITDGIRPRP